MASAVTMPDEDLSGGISTNKAFLTSKVVLSSFWILDSGCSAHTTSHKGIVLQLIGGRFRWKEKVAFL